MEKSLNKKIVDFMLMNFGILLVSFGLVWFFIPGKIASGGVGGIATIIYHSFKIPVGITMLALNVPLFLLGVMNFGKEYGFKTFYGTLMLSVYTDLFSWLFGLNGLIDFSDRANLLLGSLYGGIITGVGIGIIMKSGGSTGGTDIVAQLLTKYTKISTGYTMIFVDFCVLAAAGLVFGMEPALYATIALFALGRVINFILEGANYSKVAFIISDEYEKIKELIIEDLGFGGTMFHSRGMYTDKEKNVIMCVIKNRQIHSLRREIKEIDEKAFVVITEAYEVLGEGFSFPVPTTPVKEV